MSAVEDRAAPAAAAAAAAAQARYLDAVRRRVAWQAEAADRRVLPVRQGSPLDLRWLEQRVAAMSHDPRADEWHAYLEELRPHAGADGRLPKQLESLVRSVFGGLEGLT